MGNSWIWKILQMLSGCTSSCFANNKLIQRLRIHSKLILHKRMLRIHNKTHKNEIKFSFYSRTKFNFCLTCVMKQFPIKTSRAWWYLFKFKNALLSNVTISFYFSPIITSVFLPTYHVKYKIPSDVNIIYIIEPSNKQQSWNIFNSLMILSFWRINAATNLGRLIHPNLYFQEMSCPFIKTIITF